MALDCILPNLFKWGIEVNGRRVLDLGCGAGGLTVALAENGAHCLGIDLIPSQIEQASRFASERRVSVEFLATDVLKLNEFDRALDRRSFQLIVLSECVEHLKDRENVKFVLSRIKKYLTPDGLVYVSFPPWFNPYGGHQAGWPIIRRIPWFHLMPTRIQQLIAPAQVGHYLKFSQELNHLTISSFERITGQAGLKVVRKELFHLRPEYYWRYRIPTIRSSIIGRIPALREITTTGAFYLLAAE